MDTPAHITGRTPGLYWHGPMEAFKSRWTRDRMGNMVTLHRPTPVLVTVLEMHCLHCQAPGDVQVCHTEDERRTFIRSHASCPYPHA